MSRIVLNHINKFYGSNHVLKDVDLTIENGEFMTLLGPSGCGKTTTLRVVAGLEKPQSGTITMDGRTVVNAEEQFFESPAKRGLNLVFQSYALWPHMTVFENVAFGLRVAKMSKAEIKERVGNSLERMQIGQFAQRYPSELSGGQQQRVAIARAIAASPGLLLLDEPLSNLDAKLRLEMRYELQRLHIETGSTFVYVTHDQMEAMTLATRICLMENGVLQQYDEPLTVYNQPNNTFVADFVGNPAINFINARGTQQADGSFDLTLLEGRKAVFTPGKPMNASTWYAAAEKDIAAFNAKQRPVEKTNKDEPFNYPIATVGDTPEDNAGISASDWAIGVRPEFIRICDDGPIEGEIFSAMPTGMETTVRVRVGNYLLTGVVFGGITYRLGQKVHLDLTGEGTCLFSRVNGRLAANGTLKVQKG